MPERKPKRNERLERMGFVEPEIVNLLTWTAGVPRARGYALTGYEDSFEDAFPFRCSERAGRPRSQFGRMV